ncbi:unnamed protein product [Timema podura]|uniref:Uncharacterized protein n=1 Tax=Timema podura TaxID=61482 RepID=A0ABN7NKC0_TIMPD|nr:unnamed protein product [Timema podura]
MEQLLSARQIPSSVNNPNGSGPKLISILALPLLVIFAHASGEHGRVTPLLAMGALYAMKDHYPPSAVVIIFPAAQMRLPAARCSHYTLRCRQERFVLRVPSLVSDANTPWEERPTPWTARIRNVIFIGSVPEFAWRESGKTTVNTPNRDSNLYLPVISSPVYSKSSALDHAATEVGYKLMLIKEQRRRKMSKKQEFPHLESISRITRLPVVESSLILASGFYSKVKCSSSLIHWGLTKAESSVHGALGRAIPAANALEKPINLLDTAMCRGLDVVEKKLPAITLPPTMGLVSAANFMTYHYRQTPVFFAEQGVLFSARTPCHNGCICSGRPLGTSHWLSCNCSIADCLSAIEGLHTVTIEDTQGTLLRIGMANYLLKCAPNLADKTKPLRELLRTNIEFLWTSVHSSTFNELYASTKDYVSTTLVQPVLRRADSVLSCKFTNLAAEKIDSALDVADKYVDQYLPKTADENTGKSSLYMSFPFASWTSRDQCQNQQIESVLATCVVKASFLLGRGI